MTQTTIMHDRFANGDNGYWTLEALIIDAVKKELGVKKVWLGSYDGKSWEGRDLYFSKAKADGCPITVYCGEDAPLLAVKYGKIATRLRNALWNFPAENIERSYLALGKGRELVEGSKRRLGR